MSMECLCISEGAGVFWGQIIADAVPLILVVIAFGFAFCGFLVFLHVMKNYDKVKKK